MKLPNPRQIEHYLKIICVCQQTVTVMSVPQMCVEETRCNMVQRCNRAPECASHSCGSRVAQFKLHAVQ